MSIISEILLAILTAFGRGIKGVFGMDAPKKEVVIHAEEDVPVTDGKTDGERLKDLGICFLLGMFLILGSSGCNVTLGPISETKYVIVKNGKPVEILENKKLTVLVINPEPGELGSTKIDVGGWVAMPPEHWEAIKREINRLRAKCGEPTK